MGSDGLLQVSLLFLLGAFLGVFSQVLESIGDAGSGQTEWIPLPEFLDDTYWSGTAPLCLGGCRGKHQELKIDRCGDSNCCWIGYKSLCKVNCGTPDVDYNGVVYGNDWWVGSVVRYACRDGFVLVGEPTRTCQSNGVWTPKPTCLRMCRRGTIEVNERDLNGTCSSTCTNKSYFGPPKLGCTHIDNCRKKETGWKRLLMKCVPCMCDCSISCASSSTRT